MPDATEQVHRAAGHEIGPWSTPQPHPVTGQMERDRYCECGWEFNEPALPSLSIVRTEASADHA